MLSWEKLVESMEDHYQEKKDPNIAQMELKTLQWRKGESFFDFSIKLLTTLRPAFPVLGAIELESVGSMFLNQKVPIHWQNKLDELHQKDLQTATFSHDRDHCLMWEKSDVMHAQKKQIEQTFLETELGKRDHAEA